MNGNLESPLDHRVRALLIQAIPEIFGMETLAGLVSRLPGVFERHLSFTVCGIRIYHQASKKVRVVSLSRERQAPQPMIPGRAQRGREVFEEWYDLDETPFSVVVKTGDRLLIEEVSKLNGFPLATKKWRTAGLESALYIPLRSRTGLMGAFFLARDHPQSFERDEIEMLTEVSTHLAAAVENCIQFETISESRRALENERDRLDVLLRLAQATAGQTEMVPLMRTVFQELRKYFDHQFGVVSQYTSETKDLSILYADVPSDHPPESLQVHIPLEGTITGRAFREQTTQVRRVSELGEQFPLSAESLLRYGYQWVAAVPLTTNRGRLGMLNLGGRDGNLPAAAEIEFLEHLAPHLSLALERTLIVEELRDATDRLERENLNLHDEIRGEQNFEDIVGQSAEIRAVLREVDVVATTDATVLITGESGTGKELIARAIHRSSKRAGQPFVKVNCAAIPGGLLESEFFGHEKGAFTGALAQRLGRFELSNNGTIFLDEIGEIPLELQPKLLRVLQEMQFERLGSSRTIRVNVRIVAATNRNLKQMTLEGRFRQDLYYRLSVFPLTVPPLRERAGDIPMLVRYFVQEASRKLARNVTRIPDNAMAVLQLYSWPGNVRELQNFIERAVILSSGSSLNAPIAELGALSAAEIPEGLTLEAAERKFIGDALERCGWVVGGPKGAAAALGMKRTTLQSRMMKLGISRQKAPGFPKP